MATRCQILRLKCTKFNFGWDSAPKPAGGDYSAPRPPSCDALLLRGKGQREGRGGKARGGKGKRGEERKEEGRGGEGKGEEERGREGEEKGGKGERKKGEGEVNGGEREGMRSAPLQSYFDH